MASEALAPRLSITIGIASRGRAEILSQTVDLIGRQTRLPDDLVICVTSHSDVADTLRDTPSARLLFAEAGSVAQRNAIIDAARGCDVLLFLDDDFLMAPGYLDALEEAFIADPSIVIATGHVLADGIHGPGITVEAAKRIILDDAASSSHDVILDAPHGYGCNMAARMSVVRSRNIRFDLRLPLYAWFEDIDFMHRVQESGRAVKVQAARGVHLGVKLGRTSGKRFGYSQIANPIYLARKGTYPWAHALRSITGNVAANLVYSLRPEPYIDRRGRLRGNAMALRDLLSRKLQPERILDF